MDAIQLQHERAVGEQFVEWLNKRDGSRFSFSHREKEAPDLVYSDGNHILRLEVVGAYYDPAHARWLWASARKLPNAPVSWSGVNFDRALLHDIERQIQKKCNLSYGSNCVLLVSVSPPLTSAKDTDELLSDIVLPDRIPFDGIFLTGEFPTSSHSKGGYYVWPLKDLSG